MRINAVRSPYRRAPWYYHAARFEPGKDNVFTECDNAKHDARRKKMSAGVSDGFCCAEAFVDRAVSTLEKRTQVWKILSILI
jgi:hypothetical protein